VRSRYEVCEFLVFISATPSVASVWRDGGEDMVILRKGEPTEKCFGGAI
jgi:hypothetical protein